MAIDRDDRVLAPLLPDPATHMNRCHVVLAKGLEPIGPPEPDAGEQLLLRPTPVDQVVGAVMAGGVVQAMHVAALAMALTDLGQWRLR